MKSIPRFCIVLFRVWYWQLEEKVTAGSIISNKKKNVIIKEKQHNLMRVV